MTSRNELIEALPELARLVVLEGAPREAYGVDRAARLLSLSSTTVHELIADGELRAFNVGRRLLVSASAIREFVERKDRGDG